jgi:hypothetical protein
MAPVSAPAYDVTMGNIGKPLRKVEFEPMPDDVPLAEPSPDVTPEPVREPVPA